MSGYEGFLKEGEPTDNWSLLNLEELLIELPLYLRGVAVAGVVSS